MEKLILNSIDFSKDINAILNIIDDCLFVINNEGRFVLYNRANAKLDGLNIEEVIGKHITEIYNLNEETSITLQVLRTKKPIENVYQEYDVINGKRVTSVSNAYPIYVDNTFYGAIIVTKNINILESMLTSYRLSVEEKEEKIEAPSKYNFSNIIGTSPFLKSSIETAKKAAQTTSSVLVYGETGTGKEMLIQSIHNASPLKGPFVPLNCAAIPENLLEGILFGTAKGAFTGSVDNVGLFEKASGGTLFLDELDSMPLNLQAKLLRVIEEGKVRRIGETEERTINTRIMSALSIDPVEAIEVEKLRRDLFYRLGVVIIRLPSLREYKEDIPIFINHFINKFNQTLGKNVTGVSNEVINLFYNYSWPGNVRELEHTIESALNLVGSEEIIKKEHLSAFILNQILKDSCMDNQIEDPAIHKEMSQSGTLKDRMDSIEKEIISQCLEKTGGNISAAASMLGLNRQSLDYKIKKLGIK